MSEDPQNATDKAARANLAFQRRGLLFVLSSPSGAGKTTLARKLLDGDPDLELSISVTTRKPRSGEVDGVDYHFVSVDEFDGLRRSGQLLEWASVFDNFYGTPRRPVESRVADGKDVLFDIDWQGAKQLAEQSASDVVRVFILPPSAEALRRRHRERGLDSPEVIATRLSRAAEEISHWSEYDYVVVNTDIAESLAQLRAILHAERAKKQRQIGIAKLVQDLQNDL